MSLIFEVKSPILGFEDLQTVELKKIDEFFSSIKSVEKPLTAFTVVNPYELREYSFDLPVTIKILLDIKDGSKLEVFNIVVLQNPIEKSLINFLAPIVFNYDNMTMGQVVLEQLAYPEFSFAQEFSQFIK
ncbi:MAG: putative flagellar assembly factor FliW 1 [Pseudomonadota bacterium]|jgi:flagellar assembly factor FliW